MTDRRQGESSATLQYFSGKIDPMSTRIKGKWGHSSDKKTHDNIFDFKIAK